MSAPLRPGDLVVVAAGAAVGAALRWALGVGVADGPGFPWTTFAINVVGCFALGLLPLIDGRNHLVTLFAGPGLLGGFTTVSTYADQARALTAAGDLSLAGLYVAGTLAAATLAALAGRRLSHRPEPADALT